MKRRPFNLSNYKLLSMNMGQLVPVGCVEVLPGDTFNHSTNALIRCNPMVAPPMHPVDARLHHVYVPTRLVWDEFEDMITGGPDGTAAPVHPTINSGAGFAVGSLHDYLGVPPLVANRDVSALPARACARAWNDLFRDQDLDTPLVIDVGSGPDTTTNINLQYVRWGKDYFTTARPWEQKGPAVTIPLTGNAPVTGHAPVMGLGTDSGSASAAVANVRQSDGSTSNLPVAYKTGTSALTFAMTGAVGSTNGNPAIFADADETNSTMEADMSGVSGISVPDLRLALSLQTYEEARAMYGSEYVDYLNYLGVRSSDARLQRTEYLGGGSQTVTFSEVLGTVNNDDTDVGQLGGHGVTAMRSNAYTRFFEEHGFVISFLVVSPKSIYADGCPKMFNRRTKYDYWQKETQWIGQQEILNKELYLAGASPDGVFGYGDRYREYREQPSMIAGEFRTTLNYWHFARMFSSAPALNTAFVSMADVPERPFADQTSNTLLVMAKHRLGARRLVTKNTQPSIR